MTEQKQTEASMINYTVTSSHTTYFGKNSNFFPSSTIVEVFTTARTTIYYHKIR